MDGLTHEEADKPAIVLHGKEEDGSVHPSGTAPPQRTESGALVTGLLRLCDLPLTANSDVTRCAKAYCGQVARYYVETTYQESNHHGRKMEVKGMKVGYCPKHAPEGAKLIEAE